MLCYIVCIVVDSLPVVAGCWSAVTVGADSFGYFELVDCFVVAVVLFGCFAPVYFVDDLFQRTGGWSV